MNCLNPIEVWPKNIKYIVPCGKCLVCLSKKRNEWSFRLEQEYKRSKRAAFITLTYHPRFLPDDGLSKRHFQLFMKRLRKKSKDKLRYYAVGEYGTKTGRAHYHAIIFNFEGDEKFLQEIWSIDINGRRVPLGIVHIGKVNSASIRYTTKYCIQRKDVLEKSKKQKLNPPFALMSRQYGLGLHYLTDSMVAWHRSGNKNYAILPGGVKAALPRYYKKFIWPDEEDRRKIGSKAKWESIRAHRRNMRELKSQGYKPSVIIKEMRNAVLSRIKEKVAYTQTM